ncbi:transposase [Bacillus sp. JCM 19045]|nr:transposase [Bacillus sp. JCM 19045]
MPDDGGGHLIASIFKGSGDIDNLVPMNANLNRGEWRKLEKDWMGHLQRGADVRVSITPLYKSDSFRPDSFKVKYKVGKEDWKSEFFYNKPGG